MASNEVSAALAVTSDQREADAAIRRLEEYASPAEFALANDVEGLLPEAGRSALRKSHAGRYMRGRTAEPYTRTTLNANVVLYRGPDGAPEDKTLRRHFRWRGATPDGPQSASCSNACRRARHDVVALRDPSHGHYDLGIPGYGDSLPAIMQRLRTDLTIDRYRRVVTLGASMGGLPALRAGILLGADLAISLGGRPIWHINRMINRRPLLSPFDLLCPCGPSGSELLLVYAGDSEEDREGPDVIAKMRPVRRIETHGTEHNILRFVVAAGLEGAFLPALVAGEFGLVREILDSVFPDEGQQCRRRDV